jgi:hypothetical protein
MHNITFSRKEISCEGIGSVIALLHVFAGTISAHLEGVVAVTN